MDINFTTEVVPRYGKMRKILTILPTYYKCSLLQTEHQTLKNYSGHGSFISCYFNRYKTGICPDGTLVTITPLTWLLLRLGK